MAMVAVPEASNEMPMLPALGDVEWVALGGEVRTTYHPGGRVSHFYITPDGKRTVRSWRQALKCVGEDESGTLAQQAIQRHKFYLKNFNKSCNPRASLDRTRPANRKGPRRSLSQSNQKKTTCNKEALESGMRKDVDRNRFTETQANNNSAESSCRYWTWGEEPLPSTHNFLDSLMGRPLRES